MILFRAQCCQQTLHGTLEAPRDCTCAKCLSIAVALFVGVAAELGVALSRGTRTASCNLNALTGVVMMEE
jgi:hypothetical protein